LPVDKVIDDFALTDIESFFCYWVSLDLPTQITLDSQVAPVSFLLPFESSSHDMRAALSCWII
jgi:hypothetical protein